jgi:GrpB-like predicted nucleotidyltransferase (UPF0157 family)
VRVEVVPYDARWPEQFLAVRDHLAASLAGVPVRSIEHVGSTSVPGLAAKPRLDIDVVVSAEDLDAARDALEAAGYEWRGEQGIPERHAFHAPDREPPRNVYVVIEGSLALRNQLAVRDLLRRDERLRGEYAALKLELARRDFADGDEYAVAKSSLIQRILAAAGFTQSELDAIDAVNRGTDQRPRG